VFLVGVSAGCGSSNSTGDAASQATATQTAQTPAAAKAEQGGPAEAVTQFLEAVRTGNDEMATKMFTPLARKRAAEMDIQVAPRGSDTAKFEVGKVEQVGEDGARVTSKWTDLDKNGRPRTDEILWMVRREAEGWRIAGMAATVFEGEAPLLLDFEQPEETMRRLDLLREEVKRRVAKNTKQAQQGQPPQGAQQPQQISTESQQDQTAQQPPDRVAENPQQVAGQGLQAQQPKKPPDPFQR
jgi:hypothetical protein